VANIINKSMHSLHSDESASLGDLSLGSQTNYNDHPPAGDNDSIDTRKFHPAAINLLTSSKHTLEKTLLKVYKRTLAVQKDSSLTEESVSSGIEFYKGGPPLSGAMQTSLASDSADALFWSAFQMFAQRVDDDYDTNGRLLKESLRQESTDEQGAGIPISKLGKAMQRIVYWVTPEHVVAVANSFGLLDGPDPAANRCIGWPEFITFANRVMETLPLHPVVRSHPGPGGKAKATNRSKSLSMGGSLATSSSTINLHSANDQLPLSGSMQQHQVPIGKSLQKGTIHLSSLNDLPGLSAHRNYAKEELLDIYKREERFKRKQENEAAAARAATSPTSGTSIFSGNNPLGPFEKLRRPLIKQQVYEMIHVGDSYPVKWEAMKKKRDDQYEAEERRLARADMRMTLNRLVLIAEKSNLDKALVSQESNMEMMMMHERNTVLHQQCDITQDNIRRNAEAQRAFKARQSAALREALSSSTATAQSALAHEKTLKATLKEPTPGGVRTDSTFMWTPPDPLVQSVKSSQKQTEYDNAKKAIKKSHEETLDARIKSYTAGKQEAILRASMKGAAITVLPSPGPDLFDEPRAERSRSKGVLLPRFVDSKSCRLVCVGVR
jgi:hypothetical protein